MHRSVDAAPPAVTRLSALLADFDGTLVDSLPILRRTFQEFLEEHGHAEDGIEFDQVNGEPLAVSLPRLAARLGLTTDSDDIVRDYRFKVRSALRDAPPSMGAQRLLETCRAKGLRVAIVSSGEGASIVEWLQTQGLLHFISAIVGSDQSKVGKPQPHPYLMAARHLEVPVASCIAIEDSRIGVQSALAAGLETFVVGGLDMPPAQSIGGLDDVRRIVEERCSGW